MKILKRFLTVVNTVLFLTLSTNLPTFAQEKYFGINPIPNDYLEMGLCRHKKKIGHDVKICKEED